MTSYIWNILHFHRINKIFGEHRICKCRPAEYIIFMTLLFHFGFVICQMFDWGAIKFTMRKYQSLLLFTDFNSLLLQLISFKSAFVFSVCHERSTQQLECRGSWGRFLSAVPHYRRIAAHPYLYNKTGWIQWLLPDQHNDSLAIYGRFGEKVFRITFKRSVHARL